MAKHYSGKSFWAKQIGFALVLIIAAGIAIYLQQSGFGEDNPAEDKKTVSKGLSSFYRNFRMSAADVDSDTPGEFVVSVEQVEGGLDNQLKRMSSERRPAKADWVGEHKFRSFKAGNTLRDAISAYAQKEGMQVIWDLDQDFVIKHHFQLDDTIVGSLDQIASAVNSNFAGDVHTYVCAKQRTLVVTATLTPFLQTHCAPVE